MSRGVGAMLLQRKTAHGQLGPVAGSSNAQQQQAAATSSSNKQQQEAASTSSHNKQQQYQKRLLVSHQLLPRLGKHSMDMSFQTSPMHK